jgi:hypothetical protein
MAAGTPPQHCVALQSSARLLPLISALLVFCFDDFAVGLFGRGFALGHDHTVKFVQPTSEA